MIQEQKPIEQQEDKLQTSPKEGTDRIQYDLGIFEEVQRLIEYIPIDCDTFQIDDRLAKGTSIDSKFYFEDIDGIATRLGIIEVIQEVGKTDLGYLSALETLLDS